MSALQRLHANEDDAIWRQNASVIRHLYQEKRKTLKEVKEIMENEKGFPVTPLPIWETKLRGLGMQKKLKGKDWSLVYQHVRPRLQHEGKKKLRKPTAILINDTKKPWDDVWKEIRRNRALSQRRLRGPLPPLPPGVVIRTPSPELFEATIRKQQSTSPFTLVLQLFQTTIVSLQPLFESESQSKAGTSDAMRYPDSVYKLCLEGIPFTKMLEEMSDTILPSALTAAKFGGSQDGHITTALRAPSNLTVARRPASWKSQLTGIIAQLLPRLESVAPNGQDLEPNFDGHHYLSMVIYLLSNNIVHLRGFPGQHEASMFQILQMTFEFVPRRLLLALLQSRQPSAKATWEKLLFGAGKLLNEEAFRVLITIGMDNDWLEPHHTGHEYLLAAAQMKCLDVLHALLDRGCHPDSAPERVFGNSIIVDALENGDLECAKLLIQHCNINDEFEAEFFSRMFKSTNFVNFIMEFDDTEADHLHCLNFLLDQGADVDYEIDPEHSGPFFDRYWYGAREGGFMKIWPLSILDYFFYFHRPLFPKLAMYSKGASRFSRAEALQHLEQGVDVLREYLTLDQDLIRYQREAIRRDTNKASVHERKHHLLEVLLAEQFLLSASSPDRELFYKTLQGLLELKPDLTWLSKKEEVASSMLYATACLITSGEAPCKERGIQTLQLLLDQGFQVQKNALEAAVEDGEVAILECLARHCSDLNEYGAYPLIHAAYRNNFEAAEILVNGGVDLNSTVHYSRGRAVSAFALATIDSSLEMTQYLFQRWAKPGNWEQCGHISDVLLQIFGSNYTSSQHTADFFLKVQYIIEKVTQMTKPPFLSAHVLEKCVSNGGPLEETRRTFEYLLKKGAKLGPGSPLAEWIAAGCGHQLVQEMLDAGADPDAYSFETSLGTERSDHTWHRTPLQAAAGIGDFTLVCLLLERGADLNRPPLGGYGKTALQAICAWDPVRPEEMMRKEKIIKLLLDKGADVNAMNSYGYTALMHAAQLGDLSTAFILLKHGAEIDALARKEDHYEDLLGTALDAAADSGRLDMVNFLLNANASSYSTYIHGKRYDGAIQKATHRGHFVVAETIRKHSADRQRDWVGQVEHEQTMETTMPRDHETQPPALQGDLQTTNVLAINRGCTLGENDGEIAGQKRNDDICYDIDSGMFDSSKIHSRPKEKFTIGAESTEVFGTRVIEEVEDEQLLADNRLEEATGDKVNGCADEYFGTGDASAGNGGALYQPGGQEWHQGEHQSVELGVLRSLGDDVFMGFPGSPGP